MGKSFGYYQPRGTSARKTYLFTQPTTLNDLVDSDLDDNADSDWVEKSRRLQIRRWRKIKHQIA